MSSNVLKFPERRSPDRPKEKPQAEIKSKSFLFDKRAIGIMIIAISLFSLNYKFFQASDGLSVTGLDGRTLASVDKTSGQARTNQMHLARTLASSEVIGVNDGSIGVRPTLEDQVRHGVLASRAYVFQRDLDGRSVVSVKLQSDSDIPAYFLDPESFIEQYGSWLNQDFESAELKSEKVEGDQKISEFTIYTKSGDLYTVSVVRDIYQRLKSISQTQVAGNSFNY